MNVSAALPMSGFTGGQTDIDRQIQVLNKRKEAIFQKIVDVANGDDGQKIKEEKIKALRMEINSIDLQIQQLMRRKIEMEKQKESAVETGVTPLSPSPSDLIQPDREPKQNNGFIDIKV